MSVQVTYEKPLKQRYTPPIAILPPGLEMRETVALRGTISMYDDRYRV